MSARLIDPTGSNLERGAAALFAGAAGYAVYTLLGASVLQPQLTAYTAAAIAVAYLLCNGMLNAAAGRQLQLRIPVFDVREFDPFEPDELLLTDQLHNELVLTEADRLDGELVLTDADRLPTQEPLVLDDVLAAVEADSRVVRLFDRKAMPTPGQLGSSIDRHLEQGPHVAHPDAAQALSDALAELRRSLR